ncbi:MAG: hypothetical protein IJM79_07175 [Erysipelotrichaceae bacterium]|nr:hypothetical protein [Erysipelotrichaceae bacterium]
MKHAELINDPELNRTVYLFTSPEDSGLLPHLKSLPANFVLLEVDDWNGELSPWPLKAGKMQFAGRGEETLAELLGIKEMHESQYGSGKAFIAGYSLAGLFSLYAHRYFDGIVSCSSSLWFPGFTDRLKGSGIDREKRFYLSLGEREEQSRNQLLATVGDQTRGLYEYLRNNGNDCVLVSNPGGHFDQPDERLLMGIRWILEGQTNGSK